MSLLSTFLNTQLSPLVSLPALKPLADPQNISKKRTKTYQQFSQFGRHYKRARSSRLVTLFLGSFYYSDETLSRAHGEHGLTHSVTSKVLQKRIIVKLFSGWPNQAEKEIVTKCNSRPVQDPLKA